MADSKQRLGRGFDVLIPKDLDRSILQEDSERVQKILVTDIVPNPDQPRREFDAAALDELASSIKHHGVLQPIIVVRGSKNGYQIVAGERRWRAAQAAKLTHMPAIVRSLQELEQVELALIENIQRVDLSPLEQAMSVYKLQHQFNLALDEIAQKLGKAPSTVSNMARLLQLPDSAREALQKGKISEGHARAILALKGKTARQEELLRCILNNGWTVRQAEQFVLDIKTGSKSASLSKPSEAETNIVKQLTAKLAADVKIKRTNKGGQLIINFNDENELDKIVKAIQD